MAPDPLPVAANHAALSNRISMLLAAQSSVLKTLNPSSSTRKQQPTKHAPHSTRGVHDDDLFKDAIRPNQGVGYVPPRSEASTDRTREDRELLRGRMLGRRGAQIAAAAERSRMQRHRSRRGGGRGAGEEGGGEESEDEDLGRSALGKRKRPRREVREEEEEGEEREGGAAVSDEGVGHGGDGVHVEMQDAAAAAAAATTSAQQHAGDATPAKRKKNKKKKNKAKA